ncbi:MAG: hypothetical protein U0169_26875 [Polyangiaceae bacterium]
MRRGSSALAVTLAVTLVGAMVSPAGAQGASKAADVDAAEEAYANLEFQDAEKLAEKAVKTRGLSHDQLLRATRTLALARAVLGNESGAKDAFVQVLTLDPDYQADPNLGPRVQGPFFEAKGYWRNQPSRPGIEVAPELRSGDTGTLRVTVRDPTHVVKRTQVAFRWSGTSTFDVHPVEGSSAEVDVPEPKVGTTRLDYYAQALDDHDSVVFELGNPQAPKTALVQVGPDRTEGGSSKSFFANPIVWAVAGALVVGGTIGIVAAASSGDPGRARLTPTLFCGDQRCN